MKTTVDIDEDVLRQAMRATGLSTKKDVIHRGLEILAGLLVQQELRKLAGSSPGIREVPRRRVKL